MQRLQFGEIEVVAVDDNDRPRRPLNQIEYLADSDMGEDKKGAAQVDDSVTFDCHLGRAKVRPREECETQVDGRGVQRDAEEVVPSREVPNTAVGHEPIDQMLEMTEWNKT